MTTTASDTGLAQALATLANWPDPDAWSLVLERVGEAMENLARRLSGDGELARDAVQEALLQIRDNANSFRAPELQPDRAARSWILRVTAHTAISLRRKKVRRQRYESNAHRSIEASNMSAEHRLTTNETAELIRSHLAELPEPTRAAIILHHCEGMGFTDVASALGVPEGTAKNRVHRGLGVLRQRLARVGFTCSALLIASALEKLPATETTAVSFTATALARGLLSKKISSSLPFITKGITMTLVATISSVAAVLIAGGVGLALMQNPAAPKSPVTAVPAVQAQGSVSPTRDVGKIQTPSLERGSPGSETTTPPSDHVLASPVPPSARSNQKSAVDIQNLLDQKVTLNFQESELFETAAFLTRATDVPIEIDAKITAARPNIPINLKLEGVKLRDVLALIAKNSDTELNILPDRIRFTEKTVPANLDVEPPLPKVAQ